MLPLPIGLQRLETIAGRHAKIAQYLRLIQKTQFSKCNILDVRR
jgi:hypothetical protein